jgi:hypothetical protein
MGTGCPSGDVRRLHVTPGAEFLRIPLRPAQTVSCTRDMMTAKRQAASLSLRRNKSLYLPAGADSIIRRIEIRRGARAADRAGLENRCGRKPTEGSNPSLSALQSDAGWCRLARETPFLSGFFAFSSLVPCALSSPFSVQSGAICNAGDAGRTAPISAPLGTTVGTFLEPSVPVAWSAAKTPAPTLGRARSTTCRRSS